MTETDMLRRHVVALDGASQWVVVIAANVSSVEAFCFMLHTPELSAG